MLLSLHQYHPPDLQPSRSIIEKEDGDESTTAGNTANKPLKHTAAVQTEAKSNKKTKE